MGRRVFGVRECKEKRKKKEDERRKERNDFAKRRAIYSYELHTHTNTNTQTGTTHTFIHRHTRTILTTPSVPRQIETALRHRRLRRLTRLYPIRTTNSNRRKPRRRQSSAPRTRVCRVPCRQIARDSHPRKNIRASRLCRPQRGECADLERM